MTQERLPKHPRISKARDELYLRFLATVGERWGYSLAADPRRRDPMPVGMLRDLRFDFAAGELDKDPGYPKGTEVVHAR